MPPKIYLSPPQLRYPDAGSVPHANKKFEILKNRQNISEKKFQQKKTSAVIPIKVLQAVAE